MMKTHTISKVILWVIEKIAFTLVKGSYFYVTEGRVTRYQIFYLKRDFRKIHQDGVSFIVRTGALKLLNRKTALKIAEDQSKYGNCSLPPKLRFLPKGLDGVRPLIRSQSLISKMLLLKARLVLLECSSRFSVGVTLKSAKCFNRAWEDYINIVKTLDNKVYIVKVDIADAYGSIMHSKLLEILDKCMHTFPRNIYYDPYEPYRGPSTKTRRKLYVRLDENRQPMTQLEDNSHNKLVKVGSTIEIDTSEVFSKFELMIRGQIVRVGRKRYVLRKGVPQVVLVDVASVMACYPRYTMRFNRYKNPGKLFAERVDQVTFARLKILVINPVYTNVSGLISNLWRTGLMSGIRILALIDWLLVPKKTVNIKFICKTVIRADYLRLLENFKILSFKWAASFENHMMKTHTISKVILWVIEKIAFTLVKGGYFYVTEGRVTRYQMIYYLKRNFRKIHQDGVSFIVRTGALKLLNRKTALKIAEDQSKYGNCSLPPKLRFLPKGLDGVRPLIRSQSLISKMLLLKARLVLLECSSRFSVGVTLKSAKCFNRAWEDYINIVKTLDNKVYIVKVDIAAAYGSIMHSKLLEILDKCMHTFPRNIYYDPYEPYRGPSTKTRRKLYVRLDENRQPMTQLEDNSHNKLVKVGSTIEIDTSEVFSKFELMIRGQIVRVGRKRYVLRKVVLHGGYLSPFLCDLYYSALCQEYLGNYIDETSVLIRSVDNFYATSSHEKAESFQRLMNDGMKDYNVSLNTNKTKHNLMGPTRICFNGVIICSDTLQVLVDVASVMACYPRYTMRFNKYKNPGKLFAERVDQVTFARLKILVINPVYTNVSGLISNLWRTGLMSGIRILALIDWLLVPKKTVNIKFICKTVVRVSKKVWSRIHGTWKGSNKVGQITSELVRIVFIGGILSTVEPRFTNDSAYEFFGLRSDFLRKIRHG
ncbi:LOW QUALITY PROTEIN: uncharacterized protein [Palaemon carinicauda]|uniref:LOW QUALITY PROTEIN: uncharacterized protein n=1 Tax=Palaemon carinicauda TaxID=392227 RepID=UPI0035B5EBF2